MKKVLLTGCGGQVGLAIVEGLRKLNKYEVIATSRTPKPEHGIIALEIQDAERCVALFEGVDVVIHCAFYIKDAFRGSFVEHQIPANYIGSYNVWEAAQKNNVSRVIFCSSNHAVGYYKTTESFDERSMRPDSFYGLAKCFNELLGGYYSDQFGISCINLRIGHLNNYDKPFSERTARIFLSHRDCLQLIEKAIDADDSIKNLTVNAVSKNTGGYFDTTLAEEVLGYAPQDDGWEFYTRDDLSPKRPGDDDTGYIGGSFVNGVLM